MCEATAYLVIGDREKKIMENVVLLEPEGEQLLLVDLLGEQKVVRARIKKADFLRHRIVLEESPSEAAS